MSKDDGIIGAIAARTPEQEAVHQKLTMYRKKALLGDDAVFDAERGVFLIHGKHKTLLNTEQVITVDLPSFLSMLAGVIPTVLIPVLMSVSAQNIPAKKDG